MAHIDEFACVIEGNCTAATATTGIQTSTNVITSGNDDVEQESSSPLAALGMLRGALDIGERPAGSCSTVTGSVRVSAGADDAESQRFAGGFNRRSSDLEIPRDRFTQQVIGMRFRTVPIPAGATVLDARIEFTIDSTSGARRRGYNAPIDMIIVGENMTGTRVKFSSSNEPEDRLVNPTLATVDWETGEFPVVNEALTTENVSAILDELVNDPAWPAVGGADMVLIMLEDPAKNAGSSGSREVESYNGETGSAPLLTYTYQICTSATAIEMRTGLRFIDVDIPQGSTITGARIDFINTAVESVTASVLRVQMQDTDDAEPFVAGTAITRRSFHPEPVIWNASSAPALSNWTPIDEAYSTPDLTAMAQDVVNRPGWCGGNDMMFMIERPSGPKHLRTAYSVEGDSTKAPILTITYDADIPIPVGGGGGCTRSTIVSLVSAGNSDAEEHTDGTVDTGSSDLEMVQERDAPSGWRALFRHPYR